MKLILCSRCGDLLKLRPALSTCRCGDSWGRYIDGITAEYYGVAIPVGIDNRDIEDAIRRYPEERFTIRCWVLPKDCAAAKEG